MLFSVTSSLNFFQASWYRLCLSNWKRDQKLPRRALKLPGQPPKLPGAFGRGGAASPGPARPSEGRRRAAGRARSRRERAEAVAAAMSRLREEDDPYVVEEPSDEERALSRCLSEHAEGGRGLPFPSAARWGR